VHVVRLAMPLVEMQQVLCGIAVENSASQQSALAALCLDQHLLAGRIATPILHLSRTAELVKKGDLQAHFAKETRDEIGELADILNEMLAKLRQDVIQLRRLEKMRSQFLGNVSHELRTPIFAVQGYLETLLNEHDLDGETQKKFIDKAHNQAVRLNNLFTDLIDISRIESGEMKMNYTAFNAVKWLKKQIDDLQVIADQHHIQLRFANSQGLKKVMVHGDQERLNQVLVNLVENAIKYNRPQGHVEVSSVLLPGEIEITVKDNGRAIPEEHLSRIFERFYRVDKERSRSLGGTGLGLAIVKHIIEAHGGKVEVQSRVGEGSLFRFRLKTAESAKPI
jgi:two-component system phosphate regulon sensor histidine kinase PhoR